MPVRQILNLLLVLGGLSGMASCARLETASVVARILAVEGEATVVLRGETTPRTLAVDQRLAPGDIVHAGPDSKVMISLLPGIRAMVMGDSEVAIGQLEVRKSGEAIEDPMRDRRAAITLVRGSLSGSVGDLGGEMSALFTVTTAAGNFEVRPGGVFFLRVDGTRSHVLCAGEQVDFNHASGTTSTVEDGQWQEFSEPGVAVGSPAQIGSGSAEDGERAAALEAERQALKLEQGAANQMPSPTDAGSKIR